jgi:tetratricopeptide (TPR) repeat protein
MHTIRRFAVLAALALFAAGPAFAQDGGDGEATGTLAQTPKNLSNAAFNEGNKALKAGNYADALDSFNEGINILNENARNHLGRALALAKLDRESDAEAAYEQAISLAEAANERQVLRLAKKNLGVMYLRTAAEGVKADPPTRSGAQAAIAALGKAEAAGIEDPAMHYYYARAYNALGQYEQAVSAGQAGADAQRGGPADKAKYYYEIGLAHKAMGNDAAAKAAFENATYGTFRQAAEYEIELL